MNTSEHINSIKMVVRVAIISVIFFVVECSAAGIAQNTTGTKVLHFPADRSVGKLFVEDEADDWSLIGPAKGDVLVPASRNIKLQIQLVGPRPDDLSFLSKLGASDLHELSIGSSIRRTPANCPALESISHLTGLETLYLSQTGVDSKQLSWLRSLSSLRNLSLFHDYSVGTAGLAVLKDLPALEYFDCYTAPIDAGLEHIGQFANLKRLRLRMGRIRGPGLAELAKLPRLEKLTLWGDGITDGHVRYLEGLDRLKSLTLWGGSAPFTDATLASVGKLASLEELYLTMVGLDFTDAGMERLRGLKNLKKIEYSGVSAFNVNGAGMRHLCSLPSLESLKGVWLFSDGLEALASCGKLKSLNVRLGRLGERWGGSPADVGYLCALESLEELDVSGRGLLDEDIVRLASLNRLKRLGVWTGDMSERGWASIGELVELESLHMSTGEMTDYSLASVAKLRKLESLNISSSEKSRVTKRGLNHLNQLTNLQKLDLGMSGRTLKPITDDTALNLTAIENLKGISLTNIGLQGSDWAFLAGLEDLEHIFMNQCDICPQNGLRYIGNLPKLKVLDLQNVKCTQGNGLAAMGGLKSISRIRLMGRITDNALRRLPALPSVRQFSVTTDVTVNPETIAHLRLVLPNVSNVTVRQPSQSSRTMMQPAPQSRGTTRSAPQRRSSTRTRRTRRTRGQRTRRRIYR